MAGSFIAITSSESINDWILRNDPKGFFRMLSYTFSDPKILRSPIDEFTPNGNKNINGALTAKNDYYGGYALILRYSEMEKISYSKYHKINLGHYSVTCSSNARKVLFTGSEVGWGYDLGWYKIPSDFPIGSITTCNIHIESLPQDLRDYEPVKIMMVKMADK